MATVLNCNDLSIGYQNNGKKKMLFENINLSLQAGQLIAMLGQNGVGKSTLLRTLAGFQPPLGGSLTVMSKEITSYTSSEIAKIISVVTTDKVSDSGLTVLELVAMGRMPYTNWTGHLTNEDWNKVIWAIDKTKIEYIAAKKLYELSDGQLQKAMIARAIAQDGNIILLDEPTAHLDIGNRMEIMRLLKELTITTNKTILTATHELQVALQLADTLWLVNFNTPIVAGCPEDLALSGQITKTFFLDDTKFDLIRGKAKPRNTNKKIIKLKSPSNEWRFWTESALTRIGYEITDDANLMVEPYLDNLWSLVFDTSKVTTHSIESLIAELKRIDP